MSSNGRNSSTRPPLHKGGLYLLVSVVVITTLTYVLPDILNIDIRTLAQNKYVLSGMRMILGAATITWTLRTCISVIRGNTLTGESWKRGAYNAFHSTFLGINGLTLLLLFVGGLVLILWAIMEMI